MSHMILQINKPRWRKFRQASGSSPKHHIHPVLAVLALQNFMRHVGTKCSDVRAVFYKRRVLCDGGLSEGSSNSRDLRSWCLADTLNPLKKINETYGSLQTLTDLNGLTSHNHIAALQHSAILNA